MLDFAKEFKKKTSVNFWKRRYKNVKPEIMVRGDNDDHYAALTPELVLRLMTKGISEAPLIAADLGYKNVQAADYYVYHQVVYRDFDPYAYSDYDPGQDLYYLIAKEK